MFVIDGVTAARECQQSQKHSVRKFRSLSAIRSWRFSKSRRWSRHRETTKTRKPESSLHKKAAKRLERRKRDARSKSTRAALGNGPNAALASILPRKSNFDR
jgi:hypothetical protein